MKSRTCIISVSIILIITLATIGVYLGTSQFSVTTTNGEKIECPWEVVEINGNTYTNTDNAKQAIINKFNEEFVEGFEYRVNDEGLVEVKGNDCFIRGDAGEDV